MAFRRGGHAGLQPASALAIAAAFAAAAVSHAIGRRSAWVTRAWIAAAAIGGVWLLARDRRWVAAFAAAAVVVSAACAGSVIVAGAPRRRLRYWPWSLRMSLGVAALSTATLPLGLLNRLSTGAVVALLALPVVVRCAAFLIAARTETAVPERARAPLPAPDAALLLSWMALFFLVLLIWAIAPEVQFDALNYHLSVPRIWFRQGGIVSLPEFWHSYLARLGETFFVLPMAIGGPEAVKLTIFALAIAFAGSVFALARPLLGRDNAIRAAALTLTLPFVARCATTANPDLLVVLFVTSGLGALVRYPEAGGNAALAVAGACFGTAVATKLNAGFALLAGSVATLVIAWRSEARGKAIAAFAVPYVALAVPWYAVTFAWTGNPVFPFFNGIFRSALADPVNGMMNADLYGIGRSPLAWLRLPFALTFSTNAFSEASPVAVGGAILLALALPLCGWRGRGVLAAGYLILVSGLVLWAGTFQFTAYLVPIAAVAGVLAIAVAEHPGGRRSFNRPAIALLVAAQASFLPSLFFHVSGGIPWRFAVGRESRRAFLRQAVGDVDAAAYLNSVIRPGERVVGQDVERLRLYLDAPLITLSESKGLQETTRSLGPARLAEALSRERISYVLDHQVDHASWIPSFSAPEFVGAYATEVFRSGKTVVYRLPRHAREEGPSTARLSSGSR